VYDVVDIGIVADIDADLAAFAKAQHRTGHAIVIGKRLDYLPGRELEPQRRDPE
jgi:hypothetical protein